MKKKVLAMVVTFCLALSILPTNVLALDMGEIGCYTTITAGESTSAVIRDDRALYTWGYNGYGALGDGSKYNQLSPVKIMDNVCSVNSGSFSTFAIKEDQSLWSWGFNINGNLGGGITAFEQHLPVKIMEDIAAVAPGYRHTLAIKNDGSLWSWGSNSVGQLGDGSEEGSHISRVPVKIMDDVIAASAGVDYSMVIKDDHTLWAWGSNSSGQLGNGTSGNSVPLPTKVADDVIAVSCGRINNFALIIRSDNSLWATGTNDWGELGIGSSNRKSDVFVKVMDDVKSVSAGGSFVLAIKSDDTLWGWGLNNYGQLGDGANPSVYNEPHKIMDNVVSASAGGTHSIITKGDGSIWTFGKNDSGQLGNGTTDDSNTPICIFEGKGFRITANITTTCLKKNSISKINAAYYQNGTIDLSMKEFAYALSDNNVLEISAGSWNDETGQQYTVTAKQPGSCTVTFSNLQNGDGISVEFRVIDGDTVYSFDKVPEMTIEKGKTTNFYNHRGLVVDAFDYTENRDTDGNVKDYTVTMTVYNSRNLYGAVSSFYADGKPYEVCVIDKHEPQSTSLVGNLKDLENKIDDLVFFLINNRYYSGESISQENSITITVPAGGYLEISNDASSAAVILANAAGIILEGISVGADIGTGAGKLFSSETEIISAAVKDLLTKDFVNKKVVSTVKEQAVKELVHKKWDFNNCGNCIQAFLGSLSEHGVNIVDKLSEKIVSTTGILSITESVIRAGIPTGPLISFLFDLAKFGNLEVFYANFMESIKSSNGIYIYAPSANNSYLSNGVNVIPSDDQKDSNTVVHAYRVVDTYDISGNKYETYNISIYRNGQKVQPDSPVTVQIPLPESYNKDTVKVFRINDDGTVSNMNAEIIDGYAVFSTDHFSYYALVSGDENGVFLSRWTSGTNATITLSDPEGVLSDALFYAASYGDEGKMLDIAFATKSVPKVGEVQITFSNPLGEAWEIYALDSDYAPICPNFTLPNP